MPFDFSYLNERSLALFGQSVINGDDTFTALVEFVDRFDDSRGVYYEAIELEYPVKEAAESLRRGSKVIVDSVSYQLIHQPRITDGWVTVTARKA